MKHYFLDNIIASNCHNYISLTKLIRTFFGKTLIAEAEIVQRFVTLRWSVFANVLNIQSTGVYFLKIQTNYQKMSQV